MIEYFKFLIYIIWEYFDYKKNNKKTSKLKFTILMSLLNK